MKMQVLLDLLNHNMKLLFGGEKLTFGARVANKHLEGGRGGGGGGGADFSIWQDEQIFG